MKTAPLVMTCFALLSGCGSSEPTLDVTIKASPYVPGQYIITAAAITDEVEIQQAAVNRGNCSAATIGYRFPKTLKFGQTLDVSAIGCVVKEITFTTSAGEQSFSFD